MDSINSKQLLDPKLIGIIFSIIIGISLSAHIINRNNHYQEVDSFSVYSSIYEFPRFAVNYLEWSYPRHKGNFSSSFINKVLENPILNNILPLDRSEKILMGKELSEAKWTIPKFLRYIYIKQIARYSLPHSLKSLFALPFSSTYSPGPGFIYGLISNEKTPYKEFMSRATIVTIILFHLSVILLYCTCTRIGVPPIYSIFVSILMLFSVSMYSYGYHLGSTVWNISTASFFLWFLAKNYSHPKLLNKISLIIGILIFFNYLIIFYYTSFILAYLFFYNQNSKKIKFSRQLLNFIKTQWFAFLMILICIILFLQPGQGNRGTFLEFKSLYYMILNFFSFYTKSEALNIIQFLFASLLIVSIIIYTVKQEIKYIQKSVIFNRAPMVVYVSIILCSALAVFVLIKFNHIGMRIFMHYGWFVLLSLCIMAGAYLFCFKSKTNYNDKSIETFFEKTMLFMVLLYLLAILKRTLGFAPSRHILFLSPLLFFMIGISLNNLFKKYNFEKVNVFMVFPLILAIVGFISLDHRRKDTHEKSYLVDIESDIDYVVQGDGWNYLLFSEKNISYIGLKSIPKNNPKYFEKTLLYLSTTQPFPIKDKENNLFVINKGLYASDAYFIAYNPYLLSHNRPNNIYYVKFRLRKPEA